MSSELVRLSLHTQSSQLLTLMSAPPDFIGHPSLCPVSMPAAGVNGPGTRELCSGSEAATHGEGNEVYPCRWGRRGKLSMLALCGCWWPRLLTLAGLWGGKALVYEGGGKSFYPTLSHKHSPSVFFRGRADPGVKDPDFI